MTLSALVQIGVYLIILLGLVKPLGAYMARVYEGKRVLLARLLGMLRGRSTG